MTEFDEFTEVVMHCDKKDIEALIAFLGAYEENGQSPSLLEGTEISISFNGKAIVTLSPRPYVPEYVFRHLTGLLESLSILVIDCSSCECEGTVKETAFAKGSEIFSAIQTSIWDPYDEKDEGASKELQCTGTLREHEELIPYVHHRIPEYDPKIHNK